MIEQLYENEGPSPDCAHKSIDVIGGLGDERGFWDILKCRSCNWKFTIGPYEDTEN